MFKIWRQCKYHSYTISLTQFACVRDEKVKLYQKCGSRHFFVSFNVVASMWGSLLKNSSQEKNLCLMPEVATWLQSFVMWQLQGTMDSLVIDRVALLIFWVFFFCGFISYLIGGYTIDMSKSHIFKCSRLFANWTSLKTVELYLQWQMFLLPAQTCGVSAYKAPSIWLKKR